MLLLGGLLCWPILPLLNLVFLSLGSFICLCGFLVSVISVGWLLAFVILRFVGGFLVFLIIIIGSFISLVFAVRFGNPFLFSSLLLFGDKFGFIAFIRSGFLNVFFFHSLLHCCITEL